LGTDDSLWLLECGTKGAQPKDRDPPWSISLHLARQAPPPADEFFLRKVIGRGGCPCHEVSDPEPFLE
jgi:hypothetical protein